MTTAPRADLTRGLGRLPGWGLIARLLGRAQGRQGGGRRARAPTAMPAPAWRDIAVRTVHNVVDHDLSALAAGVTFYAVLALIPALSAASALNALVADTRDGLLKAVALQGLAPDSTLQLIAAELARAGKTPHGELRWIAAGGAVAAAGSLNAAVMALFRGLNVAYQEEECRPFWARFATAALFTGGLVATAVAVGVLLLVGRRLAGEIGASPALILVARFAFLAVVAGGTLAVIYRYGPCRATPKWRWVTPGGVLAGVVWLVSSSAVSYYLGHFAQYERSYGLLGAMLATVVWLWTAASVVLLGAELNAQIEAQTDRDTSAEAG